MEDILATSNNRLSYDYLFFYGFYFVDHVIRQSLLPQVKLVVR